MLSTLIYLLLLIGDAFKLTLDKLFPPPENETINESAFPVDGYEDN